MFVNNKSFAERFAIALNKNGHKTEILLSDMSLDDRIKVLDRFKSGQIKVLVSTNLISRGIDARKVSLVVNIDLPYIFKENTTRDEDRRGNIDLETYLHRCGRTGRFGDQGVTLNLVEDQRNKDDIKKIEAEYGINMTELTIENFEAIIDKNNENSGINSKKRIQLEENI